MGFGLFEGSILVTMVSESSLLNTPLLGWFVRAAEITPPPKLNCDIQGLKG